MSTDQAIKWWLFSAGAAFAFSCLWGFGMLLLVKKASEGRPLGVNLRQLGAAHLDWLMLALMLGLASGFVRAFELSELPHWIVMGLLLGAWINPLSYVFRAFGVNAFVFSGGALQRASAALGGVSSVAILSAWVGLLIQAWPKLLAG